MLVALSSETRLYIYLKAALTFVPLFKYEESEEELMKKGLVESFHYLFDKHTM